ncbi:ABC transporter substrate-binding protein [Rubrimonas cliftonensis]|uniref:Peptide/nickel transport system substrate-binding protein n=1 Tax=Rubrimonas cliftonensis TaxID=89524 RepID=A0A1H3YHT3_9RHOB|nr:ABC transporter substrate-binding protein [Rubrimonas cliftonensis]SEA10741.1 peptide/nickel transport system substrate-binding protein [Rubrimonas cliftonensis]
MRPLLFVLLAAVLQATPQALALDLVETPSLAPRVAAGALPPVSERAPSEPLVVDLAARGREPGVHGGVIRTLIGQARDVRMAVVYGYARLVGYDDAYAIRPDLLREVTVEDGRVFTFHLRAGHRWSDGAPFTAEDFRYWWEDVANNAELFPAGPPALMLVDGAPPRFTAIDETTVRYEWSAPNASFLSALAAARPPFIYRPAHYMKRYHERYAAPAELQALVEAAGARGWAALHNAVDDLYSFDDPELPTLQPWVNTTPRNGQRYVLARNPYYHRVDRNGRQLPYVDAIDMTVAAGGLIPAKTNRGESDLQARGLALSDAPVLKKGEAKGGYVTRLWTSGYAADIALYPNLNYNDPVWREVLRDRRFRRALSLGVDRAAINKTLFFGLARPAAMAALPQSPFYDAAQAAAWASHDPVAANALLDAMGLARGGDGVRLLPDGRPLEVVAETAGERREEIDALELIADMWRELGVKLIYRSLDRDILRNKAYAGEAMMPVWFGWNLGVIIADSAPDEATPVDQAVFTWPKWGQHYQTRGAAGEPVDMPAAERLLALRDAWAGAPSLEGRAAAWREILSIHADEVFAIGVVASAPQPVAVNARLRNFPAKAVYAWEPGAHFGVHRIDEVFFAEPGAQP